MKLNFGHGIFAFYVVFVAVLAYQVYQSTTVDHSLVADDYYARDIAFQTTLESRARGAAHEIALYQGPDDRLELMLPDSLGATDVRVDLQRPDARSADLSLSPEADGSLAHGDLMAGRWNAALHYRIDGRPHSRTYKLYLR